MSVCPFCKAQVTSSTAPCTRCGKLASDHPSIAAIGGRTLSTDFDDEDHGELALESGASAGSVGSAHAGMPYDGGKGVNLDDDLFGGDEHAGPLELDVPDLPVPPPAPPPPPPPLTSQKPAAPGSDPRISSQKLPVAPPADPSSSGRFAVAPDSSPDLSAPPAPPAPPPPPSAADLAAVRIANFPPAPDKIWQTPKYALQVLYRQFELKQDLESLRRKRSPDVALYERALKSHDAKMYKTGLAITGVALFLGLILFFMPVIKRFAFAPD